jgi:hypothetical protein
LSGVFSSFFVFLFLFFVFVDGEWKRFATAPPGEGEIAGIGDEQIATWQS